MKYGLVRSLARGLGFDVRRIKSFGRDHQSVLPVATFSPWLVDDAFKQAETFVAGHTLVDRYRLYELWQIVEQVRDIPGEILEVGVWRGGTGVLIASRAAQLGIDATVYLCDTFCGVVKAGYEDGTYKGGEHADTSAKTVLELVGSQGLTNVRILSGIFPDATGAEISESRLRLCHIDVDVKKSADDILDWVWPRLSVGGVVVYDDFGFKACDGIRRHVDAQRGLPDRLLIHNLNGHALMIKR